MRRRWEREVYCYAKALPLVIVSGMSRSISVAIRLIKRNGEYGPPKAGVAGSIPARRTTVLQYVSKSFPNRFKVELGGGRETIFSHACAASVV